MQELLNVKLVKEMAKGERFLRPADYNRAIALTNFVEEVEKLAKKNKVHFDITTTAVYKLYRIDTDYTTSEDFEVGFYKFVRFKYDNSYYYIQFDSNPLFETSYIERHTSEFGGTRLRIFEHVLLQDLYNYSEQSIKNLTNDLLEVFEMAQTVPDNIHGNKKSGIQKRKVETRQIFT